jgi:CheY-like chemotaxis protein
MAKKWVLIVDDDPSILAVVSEAIENPALSLTTAADSLQAFIQARDLKPMVIIADINMPGEDGSTILKRLREADPNMMKTVPIIFMTGMALEKARALLPKNDPMIGLVQKPLNLEMLRGYVWKLAGITPPAAPTGEKK